MQPVVITSRNPYHPALDREIEQVETGLTISELAPITDQPFICLCDGVPLLRVDWETTYTAENSIVVFSFLPQGKGSNPLAMVAMIVVMIVAYVYGGPMGGAAASSMFGEGAVAAGTAFGQMAVMLAGSLLVNAIFPSSLATDPNGAMAAPSPTYVLGAQGNSARIGQPIPVQYGRMKCFPDFGANPYAEFISEDQYLYQLFTLGQGYHDIEEIGIEDTPFASLVGGVLTHTSNFAEIDWEIVQPGASVTLFPASVTTSVEVSGQELTAAVETVIGYEPDYPFAPITQTTYTDIGPFVINAAGTTINKIGFDLVCSKGLYFMTDEGNIVPMTINVTINCRKIDDVGNPIGDWIHLADVAVTAATITPPRRSFTYDVDPARYQVKATRTDVKFDSTRAGHEVDWVGLRGYHPGQQQFGSLTMIALKMKATNNLSMQASRKVYCISTRKLKTWNPSTGWSATPTASRSIAWAIADACTAAKYGMELADSRLNLAQLYALDQTWTARGDKFDARFDSLSGFWDSVSQIAKAGRAKVFQQGGVIHCVRDQAATLPVALFCHRNILPNSMSIDYIMVDSDTADGVTTTYFDESVWQATPLTVPPDAIQPGDLPLFGVIQRDHASRESWYQWACNKYRRKIITLQTELEGYIPTFLDPIAISHERVKWGQSGDMLSWTPASKTIKTQEPLAWTTGVTHYIALRRRDCSLTAPFVATRGADDYTLTISATPDFTPYTGSDEERTTYTFGPGNGVALYQLARVLAVKPKSDHIIEITAVAEVASVHTADSGATPDLPASSQLPSVYTLPVISGLIGTILRDNYVATLSLSWPISSGADHYYIEMSKDSGSSWYRVGETTSTNFSTTINPADSFKIRVAGVGLAQGAWKLWDSVTDGLFIPQGIAPLVTGLKLFGQSVGVTNFTSPTAAFTWDSPYDAGPVPYYFFRDFKVQIFDGSTILREEYVTDNYYEYTLDKNIQDYALEHSGAVGTNRSFTFKIYQRGANNFISTSPTTITVACAVPTMSGFTPTCTAGEKSIDIDWSTWTTANTALSGFKIYLGEDNPPAAFVARIGATHQKWTVAELDYLKSYFIKIQPFDVFGDGLPSIVPSSISPLMPTNASSIYVATIYKQNATNPGSPVATASTFNFPTAILTPPTGWSVTQPTTTTTPTWACDYTFTGNGTVTGTGSWGSTRIEAVAGNNAVTSAIAQLFQNSSSAPALPSGTITYNFSTNTLSGGTMGSWTMTRPASSTTPTYSTQALFTVAAPGTTSTNGTWGTAVVVGQNGVQGVQGVQGATGAAGADGTSGVNGTRTAILDLYQWSASTPISFPSGTSTYTWATGQFTNPATLNGWAATPPAPVLGQTLYICRQTYADTLTTSTSSVTWATSTAKSISAAGVNGQRVGFLEVYQWAASAPVSFPSGTSTYTWATGVFTAPSTANGWSLTPGSAVAGQTLWGCSVSVSDALTTSTSSATWSTSSAYPVGYSGVNGTNGTNGTNGKTYTIAVTGGVRNVTFDATGANPLPAQTVFTVVLYENGSAVTPGTFAWSASGHLSGTSSIATFTPTCAGTFNSSYNDYLTITVTYSGQTVTEIVPIAVTKIGTTGTNGTNGKSYDLTLTGGVRSVTFDAAGANPVPAQTAFGCTLYENGVSVTPGTWAWSATGHLSGTSSTGAFTPTCAGTFVATNNNSVTLTVTYSGQTVTRVIPIAITKIGSTGATGSTGSTGSRSSVLNLYVWGWTAPSAPTGTTTYTWATGAISHASETNGWVATIPADSSPGKTLYTTSKVVTDATGVAASSNLTWSGASITNLSSNAGNAYRCYSKFTGAGATPSGTTTTAIGSFPAAAAFTGATFGAAFTSTAPTLATGETLWVSDGYTNTSGTITWNTPYLSTFRVGSLSALSVDAGSITAGSFSGCTFTCGATGYFCTSGKTAYENTNNGIFIGYSGAGTYYGITYSTATYRINIGNATQYLRWDGTQLIYSGNISTQYQIAAFGSYAASGYTGKYAAIYGSSTDIGVLGQSTAFHGVMGSTTMGVCSGIFGENKGTSVGGFGVSGENSSPSTAAADGAGVSGYTIYGTGVLGITEGSTAWSSGVYGWAKSTIGAVSGVYGISYSTTGTGGYFKNAATTGVNYGCLAEISSTTNGAIAGRFLSNGTSGTTCGVAGGSASTTGFGVYGNNSATTGVCYGVVGAAGSSAGFDVYAGGAGTNYGPFTGGHQGLVLKDFVAEVGDIVFDYKLVNKSNISNCILEMRISSAPKQKAARGVLTCLPQQLNIDNPPSSLQDKAFISYPAIIQSTEDWTESFETIAEMYNIINFNAVGEGQINICSEGGDIEIGDKICTSSISGKGMKLNLSSFEDILYIVAESRENVVWSQETSNIKQIACIYHKG